MDPSLLEGTPSSKQDRPHFYTLSTTIMSRDREARGPGHRYLSMDPAGPVTQIKVHRDIGSSDFSIFLL